MTASQQNLPVLRFTDRQGSDFSKWGQKKLGTITEIFDGTHQTPQYVKEGVPFYSVEQVTADQFSDTKSISEESFEQENERVKLEEGDILMTRIGSVGVAKLINWDVRASFYVSLALIKKSPNFSSQYLVQHIKSQNFQRELWKRTIHVAFPKKINLGEIGKCIVQLPSKEEQQNIASFLNSVDTKIEQLGKKKALLKQYKKGIMQKLFSQEIPFKDEWGNDFSDWERKKLGDLYEFKSTNSFPREKLNYIEGWVHNIHYGDIHTKYKAKFTLNEETVPFVNSNVDVSNIGEDLFCQEGDLVMADASEDYREIGKTIELIALNNQRVLAGLHTLLARRISSDICIGYGAYMMSCSTVKLQIKRIAQGTKVLGITASRMKEIGLPLPSKIEQRKIADFLSAIDKKIELVTEQVEQARTFKKGLLQRMFI